MALPQMAYRDRITQGLQMNFGGYNHTLAARDGELWDMRNLTSDHYPVLSPRPPRHRLRTLSQPNGIYARDGLFWVDGTDFYAEGVKKGAVTNSRKTFANLGSKIIIWPDKAYYDTATDTFGSLEAEWSGAASFGDGTFAGQEAALNTIYASGANWAAKFSVGDAVEISGSTVAANNTTIIVREIDGDNLRFYENSFAEAAASQTLAIRRSVPDMDFILQNENRLWGCRDDTIYASKLGDPTNWNVFDGLSTDSFAVDVGSAGGFTAACSYLGYPCFFKDDHVYKVYGDKPSNFSVMGSASLGVYEGCHASLAIAGETLFYLARTGVAAYTGGIPQSIAEPFGTDRYEAGVAGSDGDKYYISMRDAAGKWNLFVYDTRVGAWHREDETEAVGFSWGGGELYMLAADGGLWLLGRPRELPVGAVSEGDVEWSAEWADIYETTSYSKNSAPIPEKIAVSKILVRLELDDGADFKIEIAYDDDKWQTVATLAPAAKRSYYLPVIPRRTDHFRLRMSGRGGCRVYSLVREYYRGSAL